MFSSAGLLRLLSDLRSDCLLQGWRGHPQHILETLERSKRKENLRKTTKSRRTAKKSLFVYICVLCFSVSTPDIGGALNPTKGLFRFRLPVGRSILTPDSALAESGCCTKLFESPAVEPEYSTRCIRASHWTLYSSVSSLQGPFARFKKM